MKAMCEGDDGRETSSNKEHVSTNRDEVDKTSDKAQHLDSNLLDSKSMNSKPLTTFERLHSIAQKAPKVSGVYL